MEATLLVPDSKVQREYEIPTLSRLRWTADHPASHYSLGVMLYPDGDILDGFNFRWLRDCLGAAIRTDDPKKVCWALGVPEGETGIFRAGE